MLTVIFPIARTSGAVPTHTPHTPQVTEARVATLKASEVGLNGTLSAIVSAQVALVAAARTTLNTTNSQMAVQTAAISNAISRVTAVEEALVCTLARLGSICWNYIFGMGAFSGLVGAPLVIHMHRLKYHMCTCAYVLSPHTA